ncbi:MAG: hypothetical protein M9920_05875 [Verrucomicrobiae bacterium]|nr:hypothetical protein [Verrucomicrobiae bacterium]
MNANVTLRKLLPLAIILTHGLAWAQTKITYDITARIDTTDLLLLQGSKAQWYHPGSGAAVGRHSGRNDATTITSTLNGVTNLAALAWIPSWPEDPPAQIRYEASSSILSELAPSLPAGSMSVEVTVLSGRGSVALEQVPDATNDWTLIVRFSDGFSSSAFLSARISVELVALQLVVTDSSTLQARWPTNVSGFHLEFAEALPVLPGDWSPVTNEPVAVGADWVVPVDITGPQRYFRLQRSGL